MSNLDRSNYIFKCPNCGYLPYSDQVTIFSKSSYPEFGDEKESVTKCQCNKCGSKNLILCSVDDEVAIEARRNANKEEYIDPWDVASEERKKEIYKKANVDKLNRLLELMQRRNRLESLLILEYFDGQTNGTDECMWKLMFEIYDILKTAKADGKISESYVKEEDLIIQDSLPYGFEEIDKAIISVMNEEKNRKEKV